MPIRALTHNPTQPYIHFLKPLASTSNSLGDPSVWSVIEDVLSEAQLAKRNGQYLLNKQGLGSRSKEAP